MMCNVILNEGHIEDSHYVHCRKAAFSLYSVVSSGWKGDRCDPL